MKTHACDACGGFGYYCGEKCGGRGNVWDITHSCVRVPCNVCLGAGSFPDQMPVADAVADAETLRAVAFDHTEPIRREWTEFRLTLWGAEYYGGVSVVWPPPTISDSVNMSTLAARAAFRAVPGLRG